MSDFAKQDPRFRFDILATGMLRRVLEIKAPSLLAVHDQLTPHIEQLASDLIGPKAIEKRFGLKVNKVAQKKKRTKKVKVAEVVA
jgi:hypothetical protein